MSILRVCLTTTNLDVEKGFEVVNYICKNEEGEFQLHGLTDTPVKFECVEVESFYVNNKEGELEGIISNGTYEHRYVQSASNTTKIGDAFYIKGVLYTIVQINDSVYLYASQSNKVIYTQHESTSLEEMRSIIESKYKGIFFKKI